MRRGAWGLTGAVGALALSCGLAGAADWPRFRGPNGTGVAADKDVPVQWTAEDGPLWKVPIPGKGNSSPVIVGKRLFLQSASDDAKERMLLCLDAVTGKILWTRTVSGGPAPPRGLGPKNQNTLASSTPAVEEDRVFALFWDGKAVSLQAFGVEGEPLWKQDLGPFKSQHGPGFSPMTHDGKVFVVNDQDGSAELLAFDARTGKGVWEAKRKPFRACYSTPFVRATEGGTTELVVSTTAGVTGYDPKTGAENWSYTWSFTRMPLRTVASSIAADGLVFAHAGDGDGSRHLIAVRLGGKGDVTGTNLVWENRKVFPYVPCMLASGDYLYSVNDAGTAACHAARTGEEVWSKRLAGPVTASPILVDGKVYAIDESGEVYVFEAAPTFKLLAKNSVGESVLSSPAVADNRMYIRGREHLFCIAKTPAK
jgi:outer membrane protein assembly factor BamB